MDFTISQVGSALNHPLRPTHSAVGGSRSSADEPTRPVDAVPSPGVAGLQGLDTEYDQFGRFATAPAAPADADRPSDEGPPANPAAKYFRAGKATVQELEREYTRSLIDSYVADEAGGGVRRFIPAGMTEYQVNQLSDDQYRWAIEAERRALERAECQNVTEPAVSADAAAASVATSAEGTIR